MKKKLVKTLCLTGFLLFAFSIASNAVERDIAPTNKTGRTQSELVKADNPVTKNLQTKKMTFREKIKLYRQLKKEMRHAKVKSDVPMVVLIILAIFIPPLAVGLFTNWKIETLWDLLLTLCFWLPGVVYAFWIIFR